MNTQGYLTILSVVGFMSAALLIYLMISGRKSRLELRITELAAKSSGHGDSRKASPETSSSIASAKAALPKMGNAMMPSDEGEKSLLQSRLYKAGFYGRQAMQTFLGVKVMMMLGPAIIGLFTGVIGLFPIQTAALTGGCLGLLGMILPSLWLDRRKNKHQTSLCRALPDALDIMVICLEGGLSMQAAIARVRSELKTAHPILTLELGIVEREIQLGKTQGEALFHMGNRTDIEDIRNLATVINQSERFGASLVRSLRAHAENLRVKRQQAAEEKAQKAGVMILIPTLVFIFPAIFVVILGPAVFRLITTFGNGK